MLDPKDASIAEARKIITSYLSFRTPWTIVLRAQKWLRDNPGPAMKLPASTEMKKGVDGTWKPTKGTGSRC
jgi:hypothetical protein